MGICWPNYGLFSIQISCQDNNGGTDSGSSGTGTDTGDRHRNRDRYRDRSSNDNNSSSGNTNNNTNKSGTSGTSSGSSSSSSTGSSSSTSSSSSSTVQSKLKSGEVSILFTGDIRSAVDSVKIRNSDGVTKNIGGIAKIASKINTIEQSYPDSFIFDAGNFTGSTIFRTVTASNGTELKALGKAGYDAVNLGYNEFNLGSNALRQMILRGKNAQTKTSAATSTTTTTTASSTTTGTDSANTNTTGMPYIVGPGVNWDKSSGTSASRLKRILRTYGAASYQIIEKENTKVAVFGLMDEEAVNEASNGGVTFSDYLDYAQSVMKKIKKKKPDMIVCLVNCGKDETAGDGAADLAKDLSDVDVMITSGTGEELTEAVTEGNTSIVSAGTRGQYLGQLLMKKKNGNYVVKKYKLTAIKSDTSNDSTVQSVVNTGISKINSTVFKNSGFSYNTSLGTNRYTFHTAAQMGENEAEDKLGDLLADSFAYTAKRAGVDADVAFIAKGELKDTLYKGSLKTADIYNAMCTGNMSDPKGYDLVSFYLKGSELKNLAEIDASVANDMPKARLFFSGLSYTVNEHRLKLNRATDIKLISRSGETTPISSGKLYRVVCDTYFTGIMDEIMTKGHSMLQITPKDAEGNELAAGKFMPVKARNWYAVSKYIKDKGGVPSYYAKTHNRKILSNSFSPVALFKQANSFARIVYAVVLIPIVVIIGLLLFFRQRKNRRRGYSSSMFGRGRGRTKRYKSKFR